MFYNSFLLFAFSRFILETAGNTQKINELALIFLNLPFATIRIAKQLFPGHCFSSGPLPENNFCDSRNSLDDLQKAFY
jgi:hypothetical protein